MLRYRELLMVEQVFRRAKSLLATRPIYRQSDTAIRGHVFCSFLALILRKDLEERLAAANLKPEWAEVLRDLDRLQEVEVAHDGKRFILRTPTTGVAGKLFQAASIALPPKSARPSPTQCRLSQDRHRRPNCGAKKSQSIRKLLKSNILAIATVQVRSACVFGAISPARGIGAGLVLPCCNT